jgi:Tfp pilus assembly protein PilF
MRAALAVLALLAACSRPSAPAPDLQERWNRGLVLLDRHQFPEAELEFRAVAAARPELAAGWINAGIAALNQVEPESFRRAEAAFRRALEIEPSSPHGHHLLGVLLKHLGRTEEARRHFEQVLRVDGQDPTAHYYLATLLVATHERALAERHLRAALAVEPHLSSALLQLYQVLQREERGPEGEEFLRLFQELERAETGRKAGIIYTEMGRYGEAIRVLPGPSPARPAPAPVRAGPVRVLRRPDPSPGTEALDLLAGWCTRLGPGLAAGDFDGDGLLDLHQADPRSAGRVLLSSKGYAEDPAGPGFGGAPGSVSAAAGDLDGDGDLDLVVAGAGGLRIFRNEGDRFVETTEAAGIRSAGLAVQVVLADLDADGDLDLFAPLLFAGEAPPLPADGLLPGPGIAAPLELWNNNRDGTFTEIAARCGLGAAGGPWLGAAATDLDLDRDPDLLVFSGQGGTRVFRNDRIWRFVEDTPAEAAFALPARGGFAADLDEDGSPEILIADSGSGEVRVLGRTGQGRLAEREGTGGPGPFAVAGDFDRNGTTDLLLLGPGGVVAQGCALEFPDLDREAGFPVLAELRAVLACDLDRDGDLDLILSTRGGGLVHVPLRGDPASHWLGIALRGVRETGRTRANPGGIGALVSITAGTRTAYREVLSAGGLLAALPPEVHFGLGPARRADGLRVVWPDDVIQGEAEIQANQFVTITEVYRKGSSCPLLFAWTGERFEFVTDFLGTGGLGFFMEPGVYAPPDPTEAVLLPPLRPRDGLWEVRIPEPLEEVVYLDLCALRVLEHAEGLEVIPDERLAVEGPTPEGRLIVFDPGRAARPLDLHTREGPADPRRLHELDRIYQPGVRPDPRFLGFAAPQEIVLDFGPALAGFPAGRPIVLVLEGWVEYPYSHVNFAAWQCGLVLEPLSLDVELSPGAWQTWAPSFGYPAGMPRPMTLDLGTMPRTGTGRLRLRTNMEVHLDRVRIVEDLGEEMLRETRLLPLHAELRRSGYPRESSPDGREPWLYDYAVQDPAIEFKALRGPHTRFGDVRELLLDFDDRYVIFTRGEEVALAFSALPDPPVGRRLSFVLDTAGWCKDMDLLTAAPATVEPFPYRAMPGYPYPPDQPFPWSDRLRRDFETFHVRRVPGSR